MDRSSVFTVYNQMRGSNRDNPQQIARINRALGIVLSNRERGYKTSIITCTCLDSVHRGIRCKHRIAKLMEFIVETRLNPIEKIGLLNADRKV